MSFIKTKQYIVNIDFKSISYLYLILVVTWLELSCKQVAINQSFLKENW